MDRFRVVHGAIFDELERQGRMAVDAVALTRAVLSSLPEAEPLRVMDTFNPRCVNGACEG